MTVVKQKVNMAVMISCYVFAPQVNPQASLSVSLAQTHFCKKKGYDPQSPLCAHIILSGSVQEVRKYARKHLE